MNETKKCEITITEEAKGLLHLYNLEHNLKLKSFTDMIISMYNEVELLEEEIERLNEKVNE